MEVDAVVGAFPDGDDEEAAAEVGSPGTELEFAL